MGGNGGGAEREMRRDIFVSVVVPLDNDLDILPTVVRELDAVMRSHFGYYELIFIDDGSTYGTRAMFHLEGGTANRPKAVRIQLRPDPLAR